MQLENAIVTALEYENRIRDYYVNSCEQITSEAGKNAFRVLAQEEQGHVDYLTSLLNSWRETGKVDVQTLYSIVPSKPEMANYFKKVEKIQENRILEDEKQLLDQALAMEIETCAFYEKLIGELSGEEQELFARFLEIEEGHIAIVQAQLDNETDTGFWFDLAEFNMEY